MACAFCEITEIKERTIASNNYVWCFPTNIPIVPGHVLICPVRHVERLEELSGDEISAVFEMAIIIKPTLQRIFHAIGFNYAWNESKIAGQSVPHFHLHMLPRHEGDTGITQYEPRQFLYRPGSREASPESELRAIAKLIKSELSTAIRYSLMSYWLLPRH